MSQQTKGKYMGMNQKEATVSTILAVLEERGVSFELNGETTISEVLTDADKSSVREALFAMFRNGDIGFKDEATTEKYESDSELKKYVSGLVNNHIRKHKSFNSGQAYKAKNPGSRAGAGDAQLKALKQLLTQYDAESDDYDEICKAIDTRTAEIASEKAKSVVINADALPESLKHLVN